MRQQGCRTLQAPPMLAHHPNTPTPTQHPPRAAPGKSTTPSPAEVAVAQHVGTYSSPRRVN